MRTRPSGRVTSALLSDPVFAVFVGYVFCSAFITPYALYRSAQHFRSVRRYWKGFVGLGAFGTLFDVGHASGPLLAGLLIGWFGGQDYRAPFALIAAILVLAALLFRIGVRPAVAPVAP